MEIDTKLSLLDQVPEAFRDIVTAYSSFFLEPDMHEEYLKDPNKIAEFRELLTAAGFDDQTIGITLELCGLAEN